MPRKWQNDIKNVLHDLSFNRDIIFPEIWNFWVLVLFFSFHLCSIWSYDIPQIFELHKKTPDLNVSASNLKNCQISPPNSQPFSRTVDFSQPVTFFFIFANQVGVYHTNLANGHLCNQVSSLKYFKIRYFGQNMLLTRGGGNISRISPDLTTYY